MATDRDSTLDGDQITDRTVKQLELDITNTPTDKQIMQINMPTGDFTAINLGDIGDITTMQTNIVLNAFRIAINGSLTQFNMVDGIVDEYEDESGIDNPNSTNESYDSVNDLYSPLIILSLDTPFAHYKLNDDAGNTAVIDDGTGVNNGTASVNTSTLSDTGKLPSGTPLALHFNGSDQYIDIDLLRQDIDTDTVGSFSLWFKADLNDQNRPIFSFGDASTNTNIEFKYDVDDNTQFLIQSGGSLLFRHIGAVDELTINTWHHVVIVQDGISPIIYLDNVDITNLNNTTDTTAWFNTVNGLIDGGRIASRSFGGGNEQWFDGSVDDFRYYSGIALTSDQVALLYNSGSGTESSNFVGSIENMTLQSISFPAQAEADNARIVLLEEDVDSVTLNTDLKVFITRDSGQTFTTDFATDDKLDITSHGFSNDDRIMVTSSSQDLPAGLDSATVYYVINATTNDFELSLTSSGSAVELTDNGTGTHTAKQVTEITLANDGEYESGKNILTGSVDISGQSSGTSIKYIIVTANNKDLNIHGTSPAWD